MPLFQGLEAPYVLTQVDATTVVVPEDLPDGVTVDVAGACRG